MRLICPNCAAQYEVPDSVIPDEGRDVQCSNCGQTWFFDPRGEVADDAPVVATPPQAVPHDEYETDILEEEVAEDPPAPPPPPNRPSLSPEAADVLRQEAAREQARRAPSSLETQTELGLQDPPPSPSPDPDPIPDQAKEDEALTRAEVAAASIGAVETQSRKSRRDLLPDIEEINSSLRATADRTDATAHLPPEEAEEAARRRGFRLGFGLVALVIAGAIMAYARADDLVAALPQLEPQISAYVASVNALRISLDGAAQGLLQQLEGLTG